jgi:hypothetical protein
MERNRKRINISKGGRAKGENDWETEIKIEGVWKARMGDNGDNIHQSIE